MQKKGQDVTLYLMVGYPGSGKTTTSRIIHALTGAEHIWADHERKEMFGIPTHSFIESRKLYDKLNRYAEELITDGRSVIYDTNFNFYKDRELMRRMAVRHGAQTMLVWVQTPPNTAFERASIDTHKQATRVLGDMPKAQFDRMVRNLQPPGPEENPVILDGTILTRHYVADRLGLNP